MYREKMDVIVYSLNNKIKYSEKNNYISNSPSAFFKSLIF